MKNNFTQALRELTGFDDEKDYQPVEKNMKGNSSNAFDEDVVEATRTVDDLKNFDNFDSFEPTNNDSTNISSSMVVTGNIKSDDNIYVCGVVFGDIKTSVDLRAEHVIKGNIAAENIYLKDAKVNGKLDVKKRLTAGANVTVIGDITCEAAQITGKIKGNCDIKESLDLTSTALVYGDIIAGNISTEQGARIIGTITTKAQNVDIESEFDFDFGGEL